MMRVFSQEQHVTRIIARSAVIYIIEINTYISLEWFFNERLGNQTPEWPMIVVLRLSSSRHIPICGCWCLIYEN